MLGPMRGVIYERLAHMKLQEGGNFEAKDCITQASVSISLPKSASYIFSTLEEVRSTGVNVYMMPSAKNLASVDALMQPDKMFQMTVGLRHSVKVEGLNKAADVLSSNQVDLVFVVPPSVYDGFKKQSYKSDASSKQPKRIVRQLVMKVEVNARLPVVRGFLCRIKSITSPRKPLAPCFSHRPFCRI